MAIHGLEVVISLHVAGRLLCNRVSCLEPVLQIEEVLPPLKFADIIVRLRHELRCRASLAVFVDLKQKDDVLLSPMGSELHLKAL